MLVNVLIVCYLFVKVKTFNFYGDYLSSPDPSLEKERRIRLRPDFRSLAATPSCKQRWDSNNGNDIIFNFHFLSMMAAGLQNHLYCTGRKTINICLAKNKLGDFMDRFGNSKIQCVGACPCGRRRGRNRSQFRNPNNDFQSKGVSPKCKEK